MGAQRVRSYSLLAKCMHWAFMGIFAYAVINQVEALENFTLLMKEVLFAIIFLSLLLFRFIYMRFARAAMPRLDMPKSLILLDELLLNNRLLTLLESTPLEIKLLATL